MCQSLHRYRATDPCPDSFHVNFGRSQNRFTKALAGHERCGVAPANSTSFDDLANQRITVGVHAGRSKADNGVTFHYIVARQHRIAFDCTDGESRKVVIVAPVDTWHFRGLAADQRATGLATTGADTGDNGGAELWPELSTRVVVKKEQGLGPLNDQIVHAHCDQIDADGVVPAGFNGDLELGTDAIRCCDKNRIPVASLFEIKYPSKSADL